MCTRTLLCAALLAGALPALAAAQDLTLIPDFTLEDIDDGAVLAVSGRQAGVGPARWSEIGGFSIYPGAHQIVRAAHGGDVLMGWLFVGGSKHAARWTASTGWVALPQPTGTVGGFLPGLDMSDDGGVIAGYAIPTPTGIVGWRWTAAGGTTLLDSPSTWLTQALCVSGDGSWVGGSRNLSGEPVGRAVRWNSFAKAFEVFPAGFPGYPDTPSALRVLNHDGSLGAGRFGPDAFLWQDGVGVTLLPRPNDSDGLELQPSAMSDDGSLVVGRVLVGQGAPSWIWMPGLGTRWIPDVAEQLGLQPGPSPLPFEVARDCDAADLRIAGYEYGADLIADSWILELPTGGVGAVIDLKKALPGNTTPELDALGSFVGGSDATLELRQVLALKPTHLVIGLSNLGAHFKGGFLVPNPDLLVSFTALATKVDIPLPWPTGVPALTSVYFQVWQQQPLGPAGWAASNALQIVTP